MDWGEYFQVRRIIQDYNNDIYDWEHAVAIRDQRLAEFDEALKAERQRNAELTRQVEKLLSKNRTIEVSNEVMNDLYGKQKARIAELEKALAEAHASTLKVVDIARNYQKELEATRAKAQYERTWKIINGAKAAGYEAVYKLVCEELGESPGLKAFEVDETAPEGWGRTPVKATFNLTYATNLKEAGIKRADIEEWDRRGMTFGFPVADYIDELIKIDEEEAAKAKDAAAEARPAMR